MAGAGRILSTLGWLIIVGGVLVRVFTDFEGFNPFAGVVLVFIGGLLRGQAKKRGEEDPLTVGQGVPQQRTLNTDREPSIPPPPRPAPARPVSKPATSPQPARTERTSPEPPDAEEPVDLFGKVLLSESGLEPSEEKKSPAERRDPQPKQPMTSEEMIARARRRWDRKD